MFFFIFIFKLNVKLIYLIEFKLNTYTGPNEFFVFFFNYVYYRF